MKWLGRGTVPERRLGRSHGYVGGNPGKLCHWSKGRRSWLTACNSAERSSKVKTWKSTGFTNMEVTSDHSKKGAYEPGGTVGASSEGWESDETKLVDVTSKSSAWASQVE